MLPSPLEFLGHVLDESDSVAAQIAATDREAFLADRPAQRSFERSLEIIGEAVKQIPADLKARHPDLPWKDVGRYRDFLAHAYFEIDHRIVWQIATEHLPAFREQVAEVIHAERVSSGDTMSEE